MLPPLAVDQIRCKVHAERVFELFRDRQTRVYQRTDRMFAGLMLIQWIAVIAAACFLSPRTWAGLDSEVHMHVWLAVFFGGALTSLPVYLAWRYPGYAVTRHVIAIAQVLYSSLIIHLSGGRIESHFHVFGSLAFLAVYRDWRVLIAPSIVVAVDHIVRGAFWPVSVYGIPNANSWRWLEHAGWVAFEDVFLFIACWQSTQDLFREAGQTVELEQKNETIAETARALERVAEKAKAANYAKSQFLANMSHEVRTPMNGIIGLTELLSATTMSPDQHRQLDLVRSSAESLMKVLNDILDFSKIEAGKLEMDPVTFDVRELLADTIRLFGIAANQKGLELTYRVKPQVPALLIGDASRFRQILVNLVGNAVKFTESGEVYVDVDVQAALRAGEKPREGITLHIAITDTGVGIPAQHLDDIFEAFSQADGTMSRKYGGTGLGLAITRRLVEMMGGQVWVRSEVNCGSTFHITVRFGVSSVSKTEAQRRDRQIGSFENLRVLIVDDNSTNRFVLNELLMNWKMSPTVASDGHEALSVIRQATANGNPFSLVLLDAHMPGMDGFGVAERIRQEETAGSTTLIMLSSDDSEGSLARCRELGFAAHLIKPIKQSELLNAIVDVLQPSGRTATNQASKATDDLPRPACGGPAAGRVLSVLVAEDNYVNQQLMKQILEREGHRVHLANDGREAIDLAQNERIDVVLMDVQMPQMDGLTATKVIRQSTDEHVRNLPIVALTAHAMQGDRERCLSAGMNAYVSKPIQVGQLMQALADATRLAAPLRPAAKPKLLHREGLLSRVADDVDFVADMIAWFEEDANKHLLEIRDSRHIADSGRLRAAAHSLKGSSGNMGGSQTAELAAQLESLAIRGELAEADMLVDELASSLDELYTALKSELTEIRSEHGGSRLTTGPVDEVATARALSSGEPSK